MVGAALLWVGWFGFNAGSNLESNEYAALAMANTFIATAGAGLAWMFTEWLIKGKPSLLGLALGRRRRPGRRHAGVRALAARWARSCLGLVAGVVCFFFCTAVKNAFGYDDTLDVFGIHAVGGIIGALGTGIVADPALGGAGIVDYVKCARSRTAPSPAFAMLATYDMVAQVITQAKAVLDHACAGRVLAACWSTSDHRRPGRPPGLRGSRARRPGHRLDHGERAYNL